jgi:hypothetical protein
VNMDEIDRTCSVYEGDEKYIQYFCGETRIDRIEYIMGLSP